MTAHVVMPAIDPGVPATMSHKILTGLLRDELGFDGLIVTDALDMAGATATYPPNVAPVKALHGRCGPAARRAADGHGLWRGPRRSPQRSRSARSDSTSPSTGSCCTSSSAGCSATPLVDPAAAPQVLGAPQHLADAQAITNRTTTLVKNDARAPAAHVRPPQRARRGLGRGHDPDDGGRARRARSHDTGPRVRDHTLGDRHRPRRRVRAECRPRRGLDQQRLCRRCDHQAARPRPQPRRPGWSGPCWRPGSRSWSRRCATRTTWRRSPRRRR